MATSRLTLFYFTARTQFLSNSTNDRASRDVEITAWWCLSWSN